MTKAIPGGKGPAAHFTQEGLNKRNSSFSQENLRFTAEDSRANRPAVCFPVCGERSATDLALT
jgi:hypothetical protein